jgi:phage recombination protein Bet
MAEEKTIAEYQSRDGQSIKLSYDIVRKYLVSGKANLVTDQEIIFFSAICKSRGLNPFKKDCYLVKYTENDPAAIIVSIDYFRSRAKAQPDCRGWQCGIIVRGKDPLVLDMRQGAFIEEGEKLLGGWFSAQPDGWNVPYNWRISVTPYVKKTRDGRVTRFWEEENQAYMIAKVVESQGLRRVWPDEFQGLSTEDELATARDVTPEPLRIPEPTKGPSTDKAKIDEKDHKPDTERKSAPQETSKNSSSDKRTAEEQKEEALQFIHESTDEHWNAQPKHWLETTIKGLSGNDQLEIARAWNERNQAVKASANAPDA